MKKFFAFLRSMRFGIALLALILACSVAGSVIPQGETAAYYAGRYPWSDVLLAARLGDIFSSWYFLALMALLCVNLVCCSLVRIKNVLSLSRNAANRAALVKDTRPLTAGQREKLEAMLKRCRHTEKGAVTVYERNRAGFYGSFVTHLAILLTLIFAAASMYGSSYETLLIPVGESRTLMDGTVLTVNAFSVLDEQGDISYVSDITVKDAAGNAGDPAKISVNHPFSYAGHKFYQQEYRARGRVTVTNIQTGESSPATLEEACFLSLDGETGMTYQGLYAGYTEIDGMRMPVPSGDYSKPAYVVQTVDGATLQRVLLPGEAVEAGGVRFTMEAPDFYPGIRVKTVPAVLIALLYASFALMIAGLWLCFFHVPVYVALGPDYYALYGAKSTYGFQLAVGAAIGNTEV